MLTFLIALAVAFFLFQFFSNARPRFTNPSHDIETTSGRTTLYHYRAVTSKAHGAVILVHGFSEDHDYYAPMARRLNEAGIDCFAINLFGYGGSKPVIEDGYTVQAYARQITEAVRELKRLRMINSLTAIWGHSMGASATYLACNEITLHHPELQLVVLENPGFKENFSPLSSLLRHLGGLANFKGPRAILQQGVNFLFAGRIKEPAGREFIRTILLYHAPAAEVATANLRSVAELNFDPGTIASHASDKLRLVLGKKDKLMAWSRMKKNLVARLHECGVKKSQVTTFDADHFTSLEKPEECGDVLLQNVDINDAEAVTT